MLELDVCPGSARDWTDRGVGAVEQRAGIGRVGAVLRELGERDGRRCWQTRMAQVNHVELVNRRAVGTVGWEMLFVDVPLAAKEQAASSDYLHQSPACNR